MLKSLRDRVRRRWPATTAGLARTEPGTEQVGAWLQVVQTASTAGRCR